MRYVTDRCQNFLAAWSRELRAPPAADSLAVGTLPDGRLQLFVVSQGQLLTAWK